MAALTAGSAYILVKPLVKKSAWATAGKVAATGLGVALAVGAASVKMAADFEDSMSKIVGLVGVSRKQVDAWSKDILDMAKKLPQSPKELADAMFFITSAGLRGKTALDALKQSARASAAGLGDTATVADAVTSAMNAYGPKTISASKATDILTAAVREGKIEAGSLAPVIGKVLPIAKAMGVGFDEVAGSMALMSKSGTDAAQASTQVSAILGTFAKPTAGMNDALKTMGLSLDGVRKSLANKGMVPTLKLLRDHASKAGIDLSKVFGNKRALTGVLQLTSNMKETNSVMRGVAGSAGSTDKAFDEAARTANFKFKSALSSLQVSAIKLGTKLLPTVVSVVEKLTGALDWFDSQPKLFKEIVGGVVAFMLALSVVVKVVKLVQTAMIGLNVVMSANPIGLVVLAVAALVIGFVIAYKKSETFRTIVDGAMRGVAKAVDFVKDHWKVFLTAFLLGFGPIGLAIALVVTHFHTFKSVASSVFRFVINAFLTLVGALINGAAKAFGWVPGIGGKLKAAAAKFNEFKDSVNRALDGIHSEKSIRLNVTTKQIVLNPSLAKPRNQATGGFITGPGTHTSDSIPAYLSNGEYVVKADAVAKYGVAMFDGLNAKKFATGGFATRAAVAHSTLRSRAGSGSLNGTRLRLVLANGREFDAYIDDRADSRVSSAAAFDGMAERAFE